MPAQERAPVIRDLLYPAEMPASFDTTLICRTADPGDNKLQLVWSSENGMIRGDGESIVWTAPDVYQIYKIDVKAINISEQEVISHAAIDVVPFYPTQIDPDPEINLALPLFGSSAVYEQSLVGPLTAAEIACDVPFSNIKNYKYEWSCNGGKMIGSGIEDGTASKIGWVSPGVPGNYTVVLKAIDNWGDITVGCIYFKVKNPACCDNPGNGNVCR